jgi:hypothetical protein
LAEQGHIGSNLVIPAKIHYTLKPYYNDRVYNENWLLRPIFRHPIATCAIPSV